MAENPVVGQLKQRALSTPSAPNRGPTPSQSFSRFYNQVVQANKQYYRGKIPEKILAKVHQYAEEKWALMNGMGVYNPSADYVLTEEDDPVLKARGIQQLNGQPGTGQQIAAPAPTGAGSKPVPK